MIKEPHKYREKGAKLHRGVLLFGEPGVGKTLMARAIAGEAGTNFIFCSGSQFDEMFVGVGAKRIRQLFAEARKNTPCIIFIDEIDSLLTKGRRQSGESSSSRATINQFLAEMDGFEQFENITVIGATNHEDSLDSAATRPGRFDKKIHVPHPDVDGRKDIFDLYLDKIARSNDIDSKMLAKMTPGFTGAEIENLVNTAITQAVNRGKKFADLEDFEYARDRIMMGIERKSLSMSEKERLHTAIHEAGHAITCYFNPSAKKLYKATIVARGPSLGATYMIPSESDMVSQSKEKILAEIDVAMGGHVAEKLVIGKENISSGCGSDLQGATQMASQAVRYFGMFGEDVSYISRRKEDTSDTHNAAIDFEVKKILDESFERVKALLSSKDKELRELSKQLYLHDYLDAEEMDRIISGKGLDKEKSKKVREWEKEPYLIKF
jgi:ATP-dependent metalloprotease